MNTPSIWGPEDLDATTLEPLLEMPEGDPLLWSMEEDALAKSIACRFAAEYVWDFDAYRAVIRLGVEPSRAKAISKALINHWLVSRAVKAAQQRFRESNVANEDTALSLVYRDASDFSSFSNPVARVGAQKVLIDILGMKEKKVDVKVSGGVMVTPGLLSVDNWEAVAAETQDNPLPR